LTWATRFPERVTGAIALATSPRLTSQALAFDVVGRNAIRRDPHYQQRPVLQGETWAGSWAGHRPHDRPYHLPVTRAMRQKFGADRLQPREVATGIRKDILGRLISWLSRHEVRRAFRPQQLHGALDRRWIWSTRRHDCGIVRCFPSSAVSLVGRQFFQRLVVSARPITRHRKCAHRQSGARKLLQRAERLRGMTRSCCPTT